MIYTPMVVSFDEWLVLTHEFTPLLAKEAKQSDFWWERKVELDEDLYRGVEQQESSRYYIMMVDEQVAGYITVFCTPMPRCKGVYHAVSESLYIHPDYRKTGETFDKLLQFVEADLKSFGVPYLTIAYPHKGHKIYTRHMARNGYTPAEES